MKYVLISDLHFGAKNNSITWWKSQSEFFEKQLIPYIEDMDEQPVVICLGDVFDTRTAVSTYILHMVRRLFIKILNVSREFYVICGNHDTYTEQTDEYNSLQLALHGIGIHLVIGDGHSVIDHDSGKILKMIPYHMQKDRGLIGLDNEAKGNAVFFTHADIITGNPKLKHPWFSGHIHTPYINGNIRNIGSCYPLTFADTNADRYFYIWDSMTDDIQRISNKISIKFWRVHNGEILTRDWDKLSQNDYIEIYAKYSELQDPEYQQKIEWIRKNFKNCWVIPVPDEMAGESIDIDCDMESIIEKSIPDELRSKFEYIKNKLTTQS